MFPFTDGQGNHNLEEQEISRAVARGREKSAHAKASDRWRVFSGTSVAGDRAERAAGGGVAMLRTRPRDRESARRHQERGERVGRRRRSRDSSSGAEPVEGQEVVVELRRLRGRRGKQKSSLRGPCREDVADSHEVLSRFAIRRDGTVKLSRWLADCSDECTDTELVPPQYRSARRSLTFRAHSLSSSCTTILFSDRTVSNRQRVPSLA